VSEDNDRKQVSIRVRDDFLECLEDDREVWRTAITKILLIAEYTTDEGPWCDDYFLNLWSFEGGQFMKSAITFYAVNRDTTFQELEQRLGTKLQFRLTCSTQWASRVMWPPELAGHPYFTPRELEPTNWREKLSHRVLGPTHDHFLTEEVQAFLRRFDSKP
jgi:hypothetical protein